VLEFGECDRRSASKTLALVRSVVLESSSPSENLPNLGGLCEKKLTEEESFMKWMCLVAAGLVAVVALAQKSDDERIIENLERENANHIGTSKADLEFYKRIAPEKFITIDAFGHIYHITVSDVENYAKTDPDVKSSGDITNLEIHLYGSNTAVATYRAHFAQTGHKDKKYDVDLEITCLDVWHKVNGQWKLVSGSNTSTKPLPAEMYKMEPPPGTPPAS
jgi:hypothetical protein